MTDHDDDLQHVADRLRAGRPQLTALELDEISQRVRARAAARRRPRSAFMKSRLTILAMLVAGILLSTTGAGLAVSGLASHGNAAQAEYPGEQPQGNVLGEEESGGSTKKPTSQQAPAAATQPTTQAAQPARQAEAGSGGELPFTGYAALPVLLGGAVLLGGGLVLRSRTRGDQS